MRGVLTYFMVDQLLLKDDVANLQYGAIQAFVYAFYIYWWHFCR